MKMRLIMLLFILLPLLSKAQDTIYLRNGQVIPAIVTEKNKSEIKYRKSGQQQSAAIYSVFTSDILRIHYSNGIVADYSQAGAEVKSPADERAVDQAGTMKVFKLSFGMNIDYFNRNESDALLRFWQDQLADPNAVITGNPLSFPFIFRFGGDFNRNSFGGEVHFQMTPKDAIYASANNGSDMLQLQNFYYNVGFFYGRSLNHKRSLFMVFEPGFDMGLMYGKIRLDNTDYNVSMNNGFGLHLAAGFDWQLSKRISTTLRGGYRWMKTKEHHDDTDSPTGYSSFYVDRNVSDELLSVSWNGPYASFGLYWSFYSKMKSTE